MSKKEQHEKLLTGVCVSVTVSSDWSLLAQVSSPAWRREAGRRKGHVNTDHSNNMQYTLIPKHLNRPSTPRIMLLHLDMKPWLQLPVRCCPLDLSLLSAEQDLMKMSPLLGAEILVRSREKLLQHINDSAGGSKAELDWTVGRRSC